VFITVYSHHVMKRGTGICRCPWQSRGLEYMTKREGLRWQSMEELVIGDVLTLYAAGAHILGIVDIRDS